MAGLYVHIPFCASRCLYCGFYSTTSGQLQDTYVEALCRELQLRSPSEPIYTIYLGGGTPSLLSPDNLDRLFGALHHYAGPASQWKEVTIECNPDDVTGPLARHWANIGINRVSMGAQTFSPTRLRFLRRRHTPEEIPIAIQRLREAGIRNLSLDLMFGFPGETLADWDEDLRLALAQQVEHLSAYSLMYEEGTPLYRLLQEGKVREIDEELSLAMYDHLIDTLEEAGYEHYEISNFALKTDPAKISPFRSRHNSSYWHEVPYLGIGAAAHSYDRQSRQWNIADLQAYIEAIRNDIIPCTREILDCNTRYDDLVTTALRTREGIDLQQMQKEYGKELHNYLIQSALPYLNTGRMRIHDGHLSLARTGLYISDTILSDLMHV